MPRGVKKQKDLPIEERLSDALVPEAEQPYPVPENWCWVRLGAVASNQYGYTAKAIYNDDFPKMLRITDIQDGQVVWSEVPNCEIESKKYEKYKLRDGDIVIARTGATTGKSHLLKNPINSVFASYLIRLRVNGQVRADFTSLFLQSNLYWSQIIDLSAGIAQPGVNSSKLLSMVFPLPPLAEQQRIVDRIESLFSKLDEAKEKAQAVMDGYEDRKAAILHKAFMGELTSKWRNIHEMTLGGWENAPLEKVFQLKSGITIDGSEEKEYGAIPYVKVADMNLPDNKIQITTSSRFVDDCPDTHVIPKGSIIFPKRGGAILTNKKRYVGVEKIIADLNTMAIIPIDGRIYGWYGYYWMQSVDLRQLNNGSNVPQINNKDMVKLFVPTPPIKEQIEIVDILDSVFEKENEAKDVAEAIIDQIDDMKKSILARAFRGDLGTNNTSEEKAVTMPKESYLSVVK